MVLDAVREEPRRLAELYAIVMSARPGTAPETIRARVYEHVDGGRILRVAEGVYVASDGPARLVMVTGDAWEVLRQLPDGCISALVTDPPFDLGTAKNARTGSTRPHGKKGRSYEQRDLDAAWMREAYRVVRKDHEWDTLTEGAPKPRGPGACFILTPPRTAETRPHIDALLRLAESCGFVFVSEIAVDYSDKVMGYWPPQRHWLVHFFLAGALDVGIPWDLSVTSCLRVKRVHRASKPGAVEHEAEKPVLLFQRLVEFVTRPGDVILDPFAGRARWARSVVRSGRHVVLVEKDGRWPERIAKEDWP